MQVIWVQVPLTVAVELDSVRFPMIVGAVRTELEARTKPPPVPFSSERIVASCAEVVKALERPRVEVASQRVEVPVDCSTMPSVPAFAAVSWRAPLMRAFVMRALARVVVPVQVGAMLKTATPVPVSSERLLRRSSEAPVVVARLLESRKRARDAVRPLRVTVLVAVRPLKVAVPANAGEVLKTLKPVPVSSDSIAASWAEVVNDEPIPSVLVATHLVLVPVDCKTIPRVPPERAES